MFFSPLKWHCLLTLIAHITVITAKTATDDHNNKNNKITIKIKFNKINDGYNDDIQTTATTYSYYVAGSFEDAKSKMRSFAATLKKPFTARYNPYTQSVELVDNAQQVNVPLACLCQTVPCAQRNDEPAVVHPTQRWAPLLCAQRNDGPRCGVPKTPVVVPDFCLSIS